ncbi:MAG: type II secretion system protein G, partial [Bradymonadia bacterium]
MRRIRRWVRKYLAEILMLSVLLGMVGCVALVAMSNGLSNARGYTTRLKLKSVENALRQYSIDNGYPTQAQGLAALVSPPGGEEPYLKDEPRDAWNRPLAYFSGELWRFGAFGTTSPPFL